MQEKNHRRATEHKVRKIKTILCVRRDSVVKYGFLCMCLYYETITFEFKNLWKLYWKVPELK